MRLRSLMVVVIMSFCPLAAADEPPKAPECGTIKAVGAGLAGAFYLYGRSLYGVLTTITPDAGIRVDDAGHSYLTLSWPLQIAFGTVTGEQELDFGNCAKKYVETYRAHRVVVEPIVSGTLHDEELEIGFDTRPAYRFMWHTSESKWGVGAGLGSTVRWVDGVRASLSPEVLVQYGACCTPSFLTVSLRYDRFFAEDEANIFGLNAGWTFW